MLNKMGLLKIGGEPWDDPNANLGGFDPGGAGVYNGGEPVNNAPYEPWNDPNSNLGGYDPGGTGVYNGDPNGVPNGGDPNLNYPNFNIPNGGDPNAGGNPLGNFNLSDLTSGIGGTLISSFLNNQNQTTTQNSMRDLVNRGIPYDQSNRNAASDRLTGLSNGTINASSDPAFMENLRLQNENLMRQFNAHGMNLSGNEIGALGQQNLAAFNKYRQDELTREMQRSGANFDPSSSANAGIISEAFLAAMRGNNSAAMMAALNQPKGPSTVINNNGNGPGNNNSPGNNRNNNGAGSGLPNNDGPNWGLPRGDGNQIDPRTGLPRGYGLGDENYPSGSVLDDAPNYGNNYAPNPWGGDPWGGNGNDFANIPVDNIPDFNMDDWDWGGDWGSLGEW